MVEKLTDGGQQREHPTTTAAHDEVDHSAAAAVEHQTDVERSQECAYVSCDMSGWGSVHRD